MPSRSSVAFKTWPRTPSRFHVPHTLSLAHTKGSPSSRSRWRLPPPPGLAGALAVVCVSSFSPHFVPVVSSFTAQLFWSLAGSPQTDILLLLSSLPRVVFTSLLAHVSCSALDDWVHLSFSSTTFTCLEVDRVLFFSIHPSTWHPVRYWLGSPGYLKVFENKQLNLNVLWPRCPSLKCVTTMFI